MKFSNAKQKYLFTTKIELPNDDSNDETDYIILREPTIEETQLFTADNEKKHIEVLKQLFPKCLIDHTFTNDDGSKTDTKHVADFLKDSASLYADILENWFKSIPFHCRLQNNMKSGNVGDSSSKV